MDWQTVDTLLVVLVLAVVVIVLGVVAPILFLAGDAGTGVGFGAAVASAWAVSVVDKYEDMIRNCVRK